MYWRIRNLLYNAEIMFIKALFIKAFVRKERGKKYYMKLLIKEIKEPQLKMEPIYEILFYPHNEELYHYGSNNYGLSILTQYVGINLETLRKIFKKHNSKIYKSQNYKWEYFENKEDIENCIEELENLMVMKKLCG